MIYIRSADTTDASFLAKAILIAGRAHVKKGIWEVILGSSEEEVLQFLQQTAITTTPHLFHHFCYLIAEEDGIGPVGALGGYNPETFGYEALQQAIPEVLQELRLSESVFTECLERSARILACSPQPVKGAWVIDSVAALPGQRRRGVADKLLQQILGIGKSKGHSLAQINVYIGNEPAIRLYKKLGFEVLEEKRDKYFEEQIGSPGMISLARNL